MAGKSRPCGSNTNLSLKPGREKRFPYASWPTRKVCVHLFLKAWEKGGKEAHGASPRLQEVPDSTYSLTEWYS